MFRPVRAFAFAATFLTALAMSGPLAAQNVLRDRALELHLIIAAEAGHVAVYDDHDGAPGKRLGVAEIRAGANVAVTVNLTRRPSGDFVLAYLFAGPATSTDEAEAHIRIAVHR